MIALSLSAISTRARAAPAADEKENCARLRSSYLQQPPRHQKIQLTWQRKGQRTMATDDHAAQPDQDLPIWDGVWIEKRQNREITVHYQHN